MLFDTSSYTAIILAINSGTEIDLLLQIIDLTCDRDRKKETIERLMIEILAQEKVRYLIDDKDSIEELVKEGFKGINEYSFNELIEKISLETSSWEQEKINEFVSILQKEQL